MDAGRVVNLPLRDEACLGFKPRLGGAGARVVRLRRHAARWAMLVLLAVLLAFDALLGTLAYRTNRPHLRLGGAAAALRHDLPAAAPPWAWWPALERAAGGGWPGEDAPAPRRRHVTAEPPAGTREALRMRTVGGGNVGPRQRGAR